MNKSNHIKWGWLRFMYIYTIAGAGGFGIGIIVKPDVIRALLGLPNSDQITAFGVTGSVYFAFALLSILGLRSPLKFVPVLLLQLTCKAVWLLGVVLPSLLAGAFPTYAILFMTIFVSYIIGDLIAIPFHYLFTKQSDTAVSGKQSVENVMT